MGTFSRQTVAVAAAILALCAAVNSGAGDPEPARSVNISNSWLLPQNDFSVFYRHFKDRVTWFEADAVCQFHHAQLVTVESTNQYEAVRRYLKELDVTENVWIGLKRNSEATEFTWTNYQPLAKSGYFREEVPRSSDPVCVVADPTANFKWHSLHCGGPEVASFVCELPVPNWASKTDGCMTNMVEGMTVTFLPEHPAIQLAKECSPGVSKNVTCKGNMEQSEIIEQLSCPNSNKLLKTLFKPVKSNPAEVKPKTTTSSSESEVEDYVEMATIAQYNDETFQSISKVMGGRGTVGFPQEMSIAQEPIKPRGRNGFDTNGIDSAFIAAGAVAAATETTTATKTTTVTETTAAAATVTTSATTTAATRADSGAITTTVTPTATTPADRRESSETAGGTRKPAIATTAATDAAGTPIAVTATTTAAFETTVAAAKTSTVAAAKTTTAETPRTTAKSGQTPRRATVTVAAVKTPYTVTAASVTWDPIRVYKKIDVPQLYDAVDFPYKSAPVTDAATTAATGRVNGTRGDVATVSSVTAAAATSGDTDRDSGGHASTTFDSAVPVNATTTAAVYTTTVTATTAASTAAAAAATTVAATAAAATATTTAAANHRKPVSYESYADDHPNRNRHLIRPKQQHHHSYPYILYRLLG